MPLTRSLDQRHAGGDIVLLWFATGNKQLLEDFRDMKSTGVISIIANNMA